MNDEDIKKAVDSLLEIIVVIEKWHNTVIKNGLTDHEIRMYIKHLGDNFHKSNERADRIELKVDHALSLLQSYVRDQNEVKAVDPS